jgi:hypothetical protein
MQLRERLNNSMWNLSFIRDAKNAAEVQRQLSAVHIPGEPQESSMWGAVVSFFKTKPTLTSQEIQEARQAFVYGFAINLFYAIIENKTEVVRTIFADKRFIGGEHSLFSSEYVSGWRLHRVIDLEFLQAIQADKFHDGVSPYSDELLEYSKDAAPSILPFVSAAARCIKDRDNAAEMLGIMVPHVSMGNLTDNDFDVLKLGSPENSKIREDLSSDTWNRQLIDLDGDPAGSISCIGVEPPSQLMYFSFHKIVEEEQARRAEQGSSAGSAPRM